MEDEKKSHRGNIGAFWLRQDKRGGHYLKGCVTIEGKRVELILFTNTFKNKADQPDYVARPQIDEKVEKYANKKQYSEGARVGALVS